MFVKKQVLAALIFAFYSFSLAYIKTGSNREHAIKKNIISGFEELIYSLDIMYQSFYKDSVELTRREYKDARIRYKKIQWVAECLSPNEVKLYINGPPLPKHDIETGNRVFKPHGFQLLEQQFFQERTYTKNELLFEISILKEALKQVHLKAEKFDFTDIRIFDMFQFELVRLIALHLNGYDSPVLKQNAAESFVSIESMRTIFRQYYTMADSETDKTDYYFETTAKYLLQCSDYESVDRFVLFKEYFTKLYESLIYTRNFTGIGYSKNIYAINLSEPLLFGKNFFNMLYFNRREIDETKVHKQVKLGEILFYDPILSGNNQRSCASCHKPNYAFADVKTTPLAFNKKGVLLRNAPSLINVAYQKLFFHDGRAFQLEEQASVVLHTADEMNSTPEDIVKKLEKSKDYKRLFREAFEGTADTAITFYGILKSLAEFQRSLVDWNSHFDLVLEGKKKISEEEKRGYNLFMGKALCGTCHFPPTFSGLVPPVYSDQEFEVIGVPSFKDRLVADSDSGRYHITHKAIHLFAFKTPALRNLKHTAPYMHNGVFKSLDEVIEFYNNGGSAKFKVKLENQTLPFDSLQLNREEKKQLIAFLNMLNFSEPPKFKSPNKLPVFSEGKINSRKIGGEY